MAIFSFHISNNLSDMTDKMIISYAFINSGNKANIEAWRLLKNTIAAHLYFWTLANNTKDTIQG